VKATTKKPVVATKKPMKTVVTANETMMAAKKTFTNGGEKPIRETINNKQ